MTTHTKSRSGKLPMILAAIVIAAVFLRNPIATYFLADKLETESGFKFRIHDLDTALLRPETTIGSIEILNPDSFAYHHALTIENVTCQWDFHALLKGKLHASYLKLSIPQLDMVRNKDGVLNTELLEKFLKSKLDSGELRIEKMVLSMQHAQYINEQRPNHDSYVFEIPMKEKSFTKLDSSGDLEELAKNVAISYLPENFKNVIGVALKNVIEDIKKIFK